MQIVSLPEDAGGGTLDVLALFQLQSHALKNAQAQADASQAQIVFLQAQNGALQQQIDARNMRNNGCGGAGRPMSAAPAPAGRAGPMGAGLTVQLPGQPSGGSGTSPFAPGGLTANAASESTPPPAKQPSDGVDGLLLLSACADSQRQDSVGGSSANESAPHFPDAPPLCQGACSHSSSSMILT